MAFDDDLIRQIISIVVETIQTVNIEDISEQSDLFAFGLDSLNTVSLVLRLEEAFGVEFEISDMEYETFRSVVGIAGLIRSKRDG